MGSKKASHGLSVIKVKGHGLVRLKINLVITSMLVSNVYPDAIKVAGTQIRLNNYYYEENRPMILRNRIVPTLGLRQYSAR